MHFTDFCLKREDSSWVFRELAPGTLYLLNPVEMASLADQFLNDLSSDSGGEAEADDPQPETIGHDRIQPASSEFGPVISTSTTLPLLDSLLERVRAAADSPGDSSAQHSLLRDCVSGAGEARTAAVDTHARLRLAYAPRFPELAALLPAPREYASVVSVLRNDIVGRSADELEAIISAGAVITVQVAASRSRGSALSAENLEEVAALLGEIERIENAERELLAYVEGRAGVLAPNLAVIVGGAVAAQLLGEAGGLDVLARMPSCNVKSLGKVRRAMLGGSSVRRGRHDGLVHTCPRVLRLPPVYRSKAGVHIANKVVLAARVDYERSARDGHVGETLAAEIEERFEKWQEPPPARTAKPLPVPGEFKKKHRAGKRARKQKELYGMSEMRKQANRVNFGEAEAQYGNDVESGGLGVLGASGSGSGKLRVAPKKTNSLALAANRKMAKNMKKERGPSAVAAAGLTTTVQGIELGTMTPAPGGVGLGKIDEVDVAASGTKSVFAPTSGFLSAPVHRKSD